MKNKQIQIRHPRRQDHLRKSELRHSAIGVKILATGNRKGNIGPVMLANYSLTPTPDPVVLITVRGKLRENYTDICIKSENNTVVENSESTIVRRT